MEYLRIYSIGNNTSKIYGVYLKFKNISKVKSLNKGLALILWQNGADNIKIIISQ